MERSLDCSRILSDYMGSWQAIMTKSTWDKQDITLLKDSIQRLREATEEDDDAIQDAIDVGVIELLLECLCSQKRLTQAEPELVCEAAHFLTNITAGNSTQTDSVVHQGAIPKLLSHLSDLNEAVVEHCLACLRNIAGNNCKSRDEILALPIVEPLQRILHGKGALSLREEAAWLLGNLSRHDPAPRLNQISPLIELAATVLKRGRMAEAPEVLIHLLWAVVHCCRVDDTAFIQMNVSFGLLHVAQHILLHEVELGSFIHPALLVLGNVACSSEYNAQVVWNDIGFGQSLKLALKAFGKDPEIISAIIGVLYEFYTSRGEYTRGCQEVLDSGLLKILIEAVHREYISDARIVKPGVALLHRIITVASAPQHLEIAETTMISHTLLAVCISHIGTTRRVAARALNHALSRLGYRGCVRSALNSMASDKTYLSGDNYALKRLINTEKLYEKADWATILIQIGCEMPLHINVSEVSVPFLQYARTGDAISYSRLVQIGVMVTLVSPLVVPGLRVSSGNSWLPLDLWKRFHTMYMLEFKLLYQEERPPPNQDIVDLCLAEADDDVLSDSDDDLFEPGVYHSSEDENDSSSAD